MGRKAVAVGKPEVPAMSSAMETSPAKSQPSPQQDITEQSQQQDPAMSPVGCDSPPAKSQPTPKRTPKRAPRKAARGLWSEEQLLTSNRSQLIDIDLVKLLANPKAWNCLEEDEKREILALLPDGIHPNPEPEATPEDPDPKIAPLPQSFIRYSNNWRDGIRQFQLDLQNGRYGGAWLRQAEKARQQRTEGDFDAFKEREFEQFWGQKQKVDYKVLTGESSRVKLATLVKEGVILPGDIWKYSNVFGRHSERVHVEKEAKVRIDTICFYCDHFAK
ncbi:hypothetical protein N7510_005898 [Penicillium lagena]|uniref:uncharacterized protein n=1 Tax=Penicillium lagena TaxID=94218 RepID=UPI002541B326|nr:uncharacterized protein N7510_005898 [Penicillium lagena]KAJ5612704.1 hypothetical protein N7510_005898 [Penicillium lagena]